MSGNLSTDRFRVRLEDGSELRISSVEALARRIQRGDVLPDTPLFDGSTGVWSRAAVAPVVRFLLEDLGAEGGPLPPEWTDFDPDDAGAPGEPGDVELLARHAGISLEVAGERGGDPAGSEDDPFHLSLTPTAHPQPRTASDPVAPGDPPREDPSGPEGPATPEPSRPSVEALPPESPGRRERESWLTHPDAEELRPARLPVGADPGVRGSPASPAPPTGPPRGGTSPANEPASARTGSRLRPIVMAGVGVVVVFLAFLLLGRGPATEDEAGLALAGTNAAGGPGFLSVDSAAAAQPAPPTDLAPLADRALATFAARIQGAVDSLRIVHAVDGAPPPPWLSGPYLADARQYPEARDFWVGYGRLVADLQERDRAVFDAVLAETREGLEAQTSEADRLLRYLETRYEGMAPHRRERAAQLEEAARHAVVLHDFLVEEAESLRFTPALGSAVPRDPVLEVGTDDPEVLRDLNAHLDALFGALDRSRGGGALSQGGLRSDLFLGFGVL